jgi:hypothetical protein
MQIAASILFQIETDLPIFSLPQESETVKAEPPETDRQKIVERTQFYLRPPMGRNVRSLACIILPPYRSGRTKVIFISNPFVDFYFILPK